MATELAPGAFTAIFERLAVKGRATGVAALTSLALSIEREAKANLALHTHKYGTRTTARPGGPPALVSGTLRRAVTHTRPVRTPLGWEVRVGVARGFYPPYPRNGKRVQAGTYGLILEKTGLRNGTTYPFLHPAFVKIVHGGGATQLGKLIAADWLSA